MSKRINRDDVDKFHDYGLYIPARKIYLGSVNVDVEGNEAGVDASMTERFIKNLSILEAINKEPVTIVMNNPGGDWYHGIAIYDAIKASKCHVTIEVYGMAMSMGALILQAADERVLANNARFMIHYGTMSMMATHSKIFEKWGLENKKLNESMEDILLEKIQMKHPGFKLRKLQQMLDYDTILDAQETISYGLADRYLEKPNE